MVMYSDSDELERLKAEIFSWSSQPVSKTNRANHIQSSLERAIQELREAIEAIATTQRTMEQYCEQSKAKAVEAHKKAESALSQHEMVAVFDHSVEKTVHIRVVGVLKPPIGQTTVALKTLKMRLANLEGLASQFVAEVRSTEKLSSSQPPQSQATKPSVSDVEVDKELEGLKSQLEQL